MISKKKFFFRIPKKVDILIFGNTIQNFEIEKKKIYILNNQVFISAVLVSIKKMFLKGNFNFAHLNDIYFFEIVNYMAPKVAIGNEVNFNIFKFKKFFPKKIAIGYQSVQWEKFHKARLTEWFKMKPLICDYFFVYDKKSQKILNFIKSKFIVSGSVRNNEIITRKKKKKYDIMFISEFRDKKKLVRQNTSKLVQLIMREKYTFQSFILKALGELIKEKKLRVCIALASNRQEKIDKISRLNEKNFLHQYISKFYTEPITSYKLAEKSEISIACFSTLGKELLARNHKIMFVLYSKFKSVNKSYLPGYEGKYWYKGQNKHLLKKKIIELVKMNKKKWFLYLKRQNIGYEFDPGNKKLKKLIKSHC